MTITFILASIRQQRQSEKPAFYLADLLKQRGHQLDFFDLREARLPLFDDSPEQMNLPAVRQLKESIAQTDAVVAVFPEYNHSYGSAFKNAIDFLRDREFMHRPLGLVAVSNGQVGGARALVAARGTLPTLGAVIVPTAVQVPLVETTFPDATTCTSEKTIGQLNRMIDELEAYAPALASVRQQLSRPS